MRSTIAVLVLWIAAASVVAGAQAESYRYQKALRAPESLAHEVGAFRVDSDVYAHTRDGFEDLRIFDDTDAEVQYVVRYVTSVDTETCTCDVALETVEFKELPENRISVVYRRKDSDSVPAELTIETPIRNFEKYVSVYGGNDRASWETLAEHQPVFDYSQFIDVRHTSVAFAKKPFAYYKVTVDNAWQLKRSPFSQVVTGFEDKVLTRKYEAFLQHQEPLRLDRVAFSYHRTVQGKKQKREYPLAIDSVVADSAERSTCVYLTSSREPLRSLSLKADAGNFTRRVVIEGANDGAEPAWHNLATTEVYSIKAGEFRRQNLDIRLPSGCRYERYRLRVLNRDNPPVGISAVAAEGDVHEVLFFHGNRRDLTVRYGAEEVRSPEYDMADVLAKVPLVEGQTWGLGEEVQVGAISPRRAVVDPKHVLVAALVLMVVVLAIVLIYGAKKVEQST
jgi:hypothetical protein